MGARLVLDHAVTGNDEFYDEFKNRAQCFAAIPKPMIPEEYKLPIEKLKQQTRISCEDFYRIQSNHRLGEENEQVDVPIWISRSYSDPKPMPNLKPLHDDWIPHMTNAIQDINDAAPGVKLHLCEDRDNAKVIVYGTSEADTAETYGNIDPKVKQKALVRLSDDWSLKKRSSCHELLHALFFQHEQKRSDGGDYVDYHTHGDYQVKSEDYIVGITRFDPFSIMMYKESSDGFTRKASSDKVWKLKNPEEVNEEMSELDKVALNIVFRPCKGTHYSPKKKSSGLWYCGRKGATEKHNRPARKATDGTCGPNNYPNCPSCRVLKNPVLEEIWAEKKWQGWSGFVYCGNYFGIQEPGHDGFCGPNNGNACKDCMKYMYL